MSFFDSMFDGYFEDLRPEVLNIDPFVDGCDEFVFVVGDFFGIQKFIFDDIATKNAAKILRAKSAYIQIFIRVLAFYLADRFGKSDTLILSTSAGKFEILCKNPNIEPILSDTQSKINKKFISEFFALGGVGISFVKCVKADLFEAEKYAKLKERIAAKSEFARYSKFDLQNQEPLLEYDENINNQTLCKLCNLRKNAQNKESCAVCDTFVSIGKELTTESFLKISKNVGRYKIFENYYITFDETKDENTVAVFDISKDAKGVDSWALGSYIHLNDGDITTFDMLESSSTGLKALGILKGDVDEMGVFLKNSSKIRGLSDFHAFSGSIDNFFSVYVTNLMRKEYPNSYTVFAGGDDLFVVGAWNEMLDLAIRIREEFDRFTKGALSLSFGFITAKKGAPLSYLASNAEKALEEAKYDGKNAITAFGETARWDSYVKVRNIILREFEFLSPEDEKTSLFYNLLTFCEMGKKVKYEQDIRETMWKSKLRYSFSRNVGIDKYKSLLLSLDNAIENNPKEAKICIAEIVYKKRADKSE